MTHHLFGEIVEWGFGIFIAGCVFRAVLRIIAAIIDRDF